MPIVGVHFIHQTRIKRGHDLYNDVSGNSSSIFWLFFSHKSASLIVFGTTAYFKSLIGLSAFRPLYWLVFLVLSLEDCAEQ